MCIRDSLEEGLVEEVLRDPETSRLDAAHKALFRYIGKLAEHPSRVTVFDINELKQAGWSEEAIYDALTVASVFKFYNTWNNGSGVRKMNPADYAHSGDRLVTLGYCMDFSFLGSLKVMWASRKEVTGSDFIELLKSWLVRTKRKPAAPLPLELQRRGAARSQPADEGQACTANGSQHSLRPMPARGPREVGVGAST